MRRRAYISLVAFVATLALAHLVTRRLLPALYRAKAVRELVSPQRREALDPTGRRGEVAVIGTSLSGGLAPALATRFGGTFINRARPGSLMADEWAQSVYARTAGARLLLFELDPFTWHPEHAGELLRYPLYAGALAGAAGPAVARRIFGQLGVEGVLSRLAEQFAPARLRLSGVASAWRAPLLSAFAGAPIDQEPPPTFDGDVCEVWLRLRLDRGDLDVLDDYLGWIERERLDVIFFLPQLRRSGIAADCGQDALRRLEQWLSAIRVHLEARHHHVADFTRAVDESLLTDFGHIAHEADYARLADAWSAELGPWSARW